MKPNPWPIHTNSQSHMNVHLTVAPPLYDLDPLDPSHVARHACDAELAHEGTPFARIPGGFRNGVGQILVVLFAVGPLDGGEVVAVPVVADESRCKQLAAELVAAPR